MTLATSRLLASNNDASRRAFVMAALTTRNAARHHADRLRALKAQAAKAELEQLFRRYLPEDWGGQGEMD